jgi:hypothetical protein
MERALPTARRARGRWICLHDIWGDAWISTLGLRARSKLNDAERAKLDVEQVRTMQMAERNDDRLVEGGAGSRKTLLAEKRRVGSQRRANGL